MKDFSSMLKEGGVQFGEVNLFKFQWHIYGPPPRA